jgi:endonuclease III
MESLEGDHYDDPQQLLPVRILYGRVSESYNVNYRHAQHAISAAVQESFGARSRAYLLLKHHGQEICKRSSPKCDKCNVSSICAFFATITDPLDR